MGLTITDEYQVPYMDAKANIYATFGRTQSTIFCSFDESNNRIYNVNIHYGLWYDFDTYNIGLEPMMRLPMSLAGNVQQTSNIYDFMINGMTAILGNVVDDGIQN